MVLLHIVYHKFKASVTSSDVLAHYQLELRLKERMPFILGWNHHANISLLSSSDVNQGFTHGVIVYLKDRADLQRYLEDPQHADIKRLQASRRICTRVVLAWRYLPPAARPSQDPTAPPSQVPTPPPSRIPLPLPHGSHSPSLTGSAA